MADSNKSSGHEAAEELQPMGLSGPTAPPAASADMMEAQYEMTDNSATLDALTKRRFVLDLIG
jgi:hypothetical protein